MVGEGAEREIRGACSEFGIDGEGRGDFEAVTELERYGLQSETEIGRIILVVRIGLVVHQTGGQGDFGRIEKVASEKGNVIADGDIEAQAVIAIVHRDILVRFSEGLGTLQKVHTEVG
jgi:hypothetical protein